MDYALDIKTVIVGIATIIAVICCWRFIRHKLDEQHYREELAEEEFERSVFGAIPTSNELSNPPMDSDIAEPSSPYFSDALETPQVTTSNRSETILNRLQSAGLLVNLETRFDHHGQSNALLLVSLTNGKKALIVPNLESEAFLARHQARADYIIMVTQGDQAYVCSTMANFITDNIRF